MASVFSERSCTVASGLESLVDDCLIDVLSELSVGDLLAVRCASRRLFSFSHNRFLWHKHLTQDVISGHLPVPGAALDLSTLLSSDLERRTRRALYLKQQWTEKGPTTITNRGSISLGNYDQFVLMPGGERVIVVQGRHVQCWTVDDACRTECTGEWVMPEENVAKVIINSIHGDKIAVGSSTKSGSSLVVLSITSSGSFQERHRFANVPGIIVGLHGKFCIMNGTAAPAPAMKLLDCDTGVVSTLDCHAELFGPFISSHIFHSHLLLFWENGLSVASPLGDGASCINQLQFFRFREPITSHVSLTLCNTSTDEMDDSWRSVFPHQHHPCLTILAPSKTQRTTYLHSVLVPNWSLLASEDEKFPYRLARIGYMLQEVGDMRLGYMSGRGVWVSPERELRTCSPCILSTIGSLYQTVKCNGGPALHIMEDVDGGESNVADIEFDEGMGRIAMGSRATGTISILDLD